jgi:hypothetical protein
MPERSQTSMPVRSSGRRPRGVGGSVLPMLLLLWPMICPGPRVAAADAALPGDGNAGGGFKRAATWTPPTSEAIDHRINGWIQGRPEQLLRDQLGEAWRQGGAGDRDTPLDRIFRIFMAADPRCVGLRDAVAGGSPAAVAEAAGWLLDGDDAASTDERFLRETVSLWLGRELVRRQRFDEALPWLGGLDVETSVDPVSLLFYQAACEHWLLRIEPALASLDRLLEREEEIPVRYARLARMLRVDLEPLEEDSLDHIARRMRDVTRRLDLGHAGNRVRGVQDEVVAALDKLIKKLEDQQNQNQSGGGGGAAGNGGNGSPMDDSRIAGGRGPGEVTKKDIGEGDGWGNLPPQQRDEALQQIGRDFPAHYREAIEHYFKRLAAGERGAENR